MHYDTIKMFIVYKEKRRTFLSDSNITKKALAASLKELMDTIPLSKISISNICGRCDMDRKSFYYHFKDKYDLISWIFNTDFVTVLYSKTYSSIWKVLSDICTYLYENRKFYRNALPIGGQNSFSDYFRKFLESVFLEYEKDIFDKVAPIAFYRTFFSDTFITAIHRWILSKDCIQPNEFVTNLKACTIYIAKNAVENSI